MRRCPTTRRRFSKATLTTLSLFRCGRRSRVGIASMKMLSATWSAQSRGGKKMSRESKHAMENLNAVEAAVRALAQLNRADIRRKLIEFHESLESATPTVPVVVEKIILSNFD